MRAWVLAAVVLAAGCGKKAEPTEAGPAPEVSKAEPGGVKVGDRPKGEASKPEERPAEAATEVTSPDLVKAYHDNRIAADQKYTGKRVRTRIMVEKIGRTPAGVAFAGSVYGGPAREPTVVLEFSKDREGVFADLKPGHVLVAEGVCRGRVDDGVPRAIRGFEFFVRIEDTRILEHITK